MRKSNIWRASRSTGVVAVLVSSLLSGVTPAVLPASASHADSTSGATTTVPALGPIDPNTGYPFWVQDRTGEKLELCFDRATPPTGYCLAAPTDPGSRPWVDEDPANSNVAADPETFWFDATASIDATATGGADALFVAAKEATFGGADEAARAGEQIAFGRVRIRIDNLVPGAEYRIIHPYGAETYTAEDGDGDPATGRDGEVNVTEDIGCLDVPCDFTKTLGSRVVSFLRWDPTVGPAAPNGYVGDPGVEHAVTGSPVGTNIFRVEGPQVGGSGVDTIQTDQFSVQGRLWAPTEPMLGMVATSNIVDFGKVPHATPAPAGGDTGGLPIPPGGPVVDLPSEPAPSAAGEPAAVQTLQLTNAGAGSLTLGQLSLVGRDADSFRLTANSCDDAELAADAICTVNVEFVPTKAGPATAAVQVTSNGADAEPYQRVLLRADAADGSDPRDRRATGPVSLQHGFPLWYQDESTNGSDGQGLKLALCDDPTDPMCLPPAEPYTPANGPMAFPRNFPHELFWWSAEAHTETNNGHEAELVLAHEAAFSNEEPRPGDQIVFGRVRVRVGGLIAGEEYRVTTPYGRFTFVAEDDEDRGINYTEDLGCLEVPCDFSRVNRHSKVGPFLVRTGDNPPPDGYVGDPNVDGPVTPGTHGAVFRVQGPHVYAPEGDDSEAPPPVDGCPEVDGPVTDCVEIDEFSVSGKKWEQPARGMLALDDTSNTLRVGTDAPRAITFTNVGAQPVTVGQLSLPDDGGFTLTSDGCSGTSVPAGGECVVTVQADPDRGGARATLAVPTTDPAVDGSVLLHSTGGTTQPPAPSMPDLVAADDTGVSDSDDVTRATQLRFTGAGQTGHDVVLLVDGEARAFTTVTPAAAWSATITLEQSGTYRVQAAYPGGVPSDALLVTVDQEPPGQAPVLQLATAGTTGPDGDIVTADLTPTVTGTVPSSTAAAAPAGGDGTSVRLLVDGSAVGLAPVAGDGSFALTLPTLAPGRHEVVGEIVDAAGNTGPRSRPLLLRVDVAAPSVSVPEVVPTEGSQLSGRRVTSTVSWTGRDGGGGLTYQVQSSRDGGPWRPVSAGRPQTSAEVVQVDRSRYRYRVRAVDAAGNLSGWVVTAPVRSLLVEDGASAVDYSAGWRRVRRPGASDGSMRLAAAAGSRAVWTGRARTATLITSTGPTRGRVAISVNGVRQRVADLYNPRGRNRELAVTVDLTARARSRVEVRVLPGSNGAATGTQVFLDAWVIMR